MATIRWTRPDSSDPGSDGPALLPRIQDPSILPRGLRGGGPQLSAGTPPRHTHGRGQPAGHGRPALDEVCVWMYMCTTKGSISHVLSSVWHMVP